MKAMTRLIHSDFLKLKGTAFGAIHIFMPILGALIFLGYYSFSKWNPVFKVSSFMEVLAITFPFLVGIVTALIVDQEANASNFQEILTCRYGKATAFISKFMVLIISSLFSLLIAIGGFYLGYQFILKQNTLPISFYIKALLILTGCQLFIYLFHMFISFRFGKGASIITGITETIVGALMLTGLGEGIWQYIPCAWGARFVDLYTFYTVNSGSFAIRNGELRLGVGLAVGLSLVLLVVTPLWFRSYEGHKEE